MRTIRSRVKLWDSPPPLGVFLAVGGHSLKRVKCSCRRGRGFSHANVVTKDGIKRTFVDIRTERAESSYLDLLGLAKRFGGGGVVFL